MEASLIADGEGACRNLNTYNVLPLLLEQGDVGHDAHRVAYGVGDVLHQFVGVLDADGLLGSVLYADVQRPALRVRVAADPLQVLLVPGFLVLDRLVLFSFHFRISAQIIP